MNSRQKFNKKNLLYWGIAVLLLAILWLGTFRDRQRGLERTDYEIVLLGDSLVGQCRDETSVAALLSERIGTSVFNGAFGGTYMTLQYRDQESSYGKDLLSMVSLMKAIDADDFGVQKTIRHRQAVTYYFEKTIEYLECIDFSTVKLLVLEHGLNDYHAAVPIDNEKDPTDESTYAGALRSVIGTLRKRYPDMRIVLVTPTYTWYCYQGITCEEYDTGNGYLEKYVDAQIDVAEEMGVEIVDLYHTAYSHENWEDWMLYTEDGLHPNENGRRIMAEKIADGLEAVQ